jgi:hypothetical protein
MLQTTLCPTEDDSGMLMSYAVINVSMCGQEGGKRRQWGLGKRLKPGELSLSIGPARMEVHFFVHLSMYEGYLFIFINTTHAINIMYLLAML